MASHIENIILIISIFIGAYSVTKINKKYFIYLFTFIVFLLLSSSAASAGSCTAKGIRLQGRVRVVPNGGDLRVLRVSEFPDIRVQKVSHSPNECGRWLFVSQGEDFTIEYVTNAPDVRVRFVKEFPGT